MFTIFPSAKMLRKCKVMSLAGDMHSTQELGWVHEILHLYIGRSKKLRLSCQMYGNSCRRQIDNHVFFCLLSWCFQSPNGKCKKTRATVRHSNVYQTTIHNIGRWLIQMQPTNIWLNQITTQAVQHNDNIIVSQQLASANSLWPSFVSRNAQFIHDLTGSQGLASAERCIDSPDKNHEINM